MGGSRAMRCGDGQLGVRRAQLEKAHLHGMQVSIGRLAHGQLDGSNTQAPDISLEIVATLLDDFWTHPVGCAYKGVLFGHGGSELTRDTKVSEFDVSRC